MDLSVDYSHDFGSAEDNNQDNFCKESSPVQLPPVVLKRKQGRPRKDSNVIQHGSQKLLSKKVRIGISLQNKENIFFYFSRRNIQTFVTFAKLEKHLRGFLL